MFTVAETWRGIPILTDGCRYYVADGFGDFYIFGSVDAAINHIETGEV